MTLEEFLAETLPELPEQATVRLMKDYGLSEDVALVITGDPPAVAMYEAAVKTASQGATHAKKLPQTVANWLCNDLFALVKEGVPDDQVVSVQYSPVSGIQLGELVALINEGTVSTAIGKKILAVMYNEDLGKSPRDISTERGWKVISDLGELRKMCLRVLQDPQHASQLEQYKKGGKHVRKIQKFFLGKVMGESRGNAHPELLNDALNDALEELAPNVE